MTDKQKNKVIQLLDDPDAVNKDLLNQFLWANNAVNTKFEVGDYVIINLPDRYIWQAPCENIYGTIDRIEYNSDKKIITYTIEVCIIDSQGTELTSKVKLSSDDKYFSFMKKVKALQQNSIKALRPNLNS